MKSRDGLALALLALLSNDTTLTLAQYVTTVTVSINTDPFCTGIGAFGGSAAGAGNTSGSGAGGSGFGSGSGASIGSGNGTGSATNSGAPIMPSNNTTGHNTTGHFDALGYYPAPADGDLLGGDECNCGSSAPNGSPSSVPPSKNKREVTSGDCIPCAGNSSECCGAPGGYALVYHVTPNVASLSAVPYSTIESASSTIGTSSTSYSPISSASVVADSSTGSDESVVIGSTTSSAAVESTSTYVYSTTDSSYFSNYTFSNTAITAATITPGSATANITNTATAANGGNSGVNATATNGGNSSTVATTIGGNSGATETTAHGGNTSGMDPSVYGVDGGATATANGGATATVGSSTAEQTLESATPSCVSSANYVGNNTKYSDYFGYTYDIRCNLDLQSSPADSDAHAESFEDCLEYCSLLTDCVAVTYQDPPSIPSNSSNCYPKWSFGGYAASTVDGLYSGVNVNGPSPGTLEDQNLCTTNNTQGVSYDNQAYYDDYGNAWTIGCDNTLAIPGSAALSSTVTDTLASCVDYCGVYDSCEMVNWTGPHINGTANDPNCFPASSNGTAGAADSAPGSGYAVSSPS
ncbi:hypothetical protein HO133_008925 [Letharia lupina]|uniref:Apple domain-containing protein n=1 Tax=Letharia lupina TaxID=560253 RepID=A0A8H6FGQ1_9LECA|nr:uncharacterized protein HO133_008925 [Letharia lupina]KAF6227481.1 hypothetical protein HO133_008925 [Letharia lupina]